MTEPTTQPKLVDHQNMVVYYDPKDLSGLAVIDKIVKYWGQIEPYFAVAKYEGDESKQAINVEKGNIKRALEKSKDKDNKIADLEARLLKLENK